MKERVYLETSFISYLTARLSRDLIVAGHQQITQDWWYRRRQDYDLYVSQIVVREAGGGDAEAARERLQIVESLTILGVSEAATSLAETLVEAGALPAKAGADALHIAIAAVNHIKYLLTWNCRHLNNATMRPHIEAACESKGHKAPIICTPEEILEGQP